jgi:hypothetical protein
MIDYRDFAHRFAARDGRWGLMKLFLRQWDLPRKGADRVPLADIKAAEKRLGFGLPAALMEWYRLPFNPVVLSPHLFWTDLRMPGELRAWPRRTGNQLVVFLADYQGCREWAFSVADAGRDDPPVYFGTTQGGWPPNRWKQQSKSLSAFLQQLLMVRSVDFAWRYPACAQANQDAPWGRLKSVFQDIGFGPWLEYGSACRLFGGPDALLLVDSAPPWGPAYNFVLNARTAKARDRITQLPGVKWGVGRRGTWVEVGV